MSMLKSFICVSLVFTDYICDKIQTNGSQIKNGGVITLTIAVCSVSTAVLGDTQPPTVSFPVV